MRCELHSACVRGKTRSLSALASGLFVLGPLVLGPCLAAKPNDPSQRPLWIPNGVPSPPTRSLVPESAWIHAFWGIRAPATVVTPKVRENKVVSLAQVRIDDALIAGLHTCAAMEQLVGSLRARGVPIRNVALADQGFHRNGPWFFQTVLDGERVLSTVPTYQQAPLAGGQLVFGTIPRIAATGSMIEAKNRRERQRADSENRLPAPLLAKKGLFPPLVDPRQNHAFSLLEPAVADVLTNGEAVRDPLYSDSVKYTRAVTLKGPEHGRQVTFPMTVCATENQVPITFYPDIDARHLARLEPRYLSLTALDLAMTACAPSRLKKGTPKARWERLQLGQLLFFDELLANAAVESISQLGLNPPMKKTLKRLVSTRQKSGARLSDEEVIAELTHGLKRVVTKDEADLRHGLALLRLLDGQFLDTRYGVFEDP
jgi:hypothetical protein